MVGEDEFTVVYPGYPFPKGAVRAMCRGLDTNDPDAMDSYVALWLRDDGEAVFGRAFNKDGKVEAYFCWGGGVIHSSQTKGFRMLTYVGPTEKHSFKYKWVKAHKAYPQKVVTVGGYCPAVVQTPDGQEALGKANFGRHMAWTADIRNNSESVHEGQEFRESHILCKA